MPIYDKDSEFARKRDQAIAQIEAERLEELRQAVEREPERFVSPERFYELAREAGIDVDDE